MKRSALLSVSLISIVAGLMLPILSVAQQDSGQQDPAKQEPPKKTTKLDFQKDIVPIVKANCISCHNKDKAEHNVIFPDKMTEEDAIKNAKMWKKSAREVKGKQMPPKGKDGTMSDKDREKFLEWVDAKIPTPARRGGGGNGGGN
jgi:uncharacterized membrane protein